MPNPESHTSRAGDTTSPATDHSPARDERVTACSATRTPRLPKSRNAISTQVRSVDQPPPPSRREAQGFRAAPSRKPPPRATSGLRGEWQGSDGINTAPTGVPDCRSAGRPAETPSAVREPATHRVMPQCSWAPTTLGVRSFSGSRTPTAVTSTASRIRARGPEIRAIDHGRDAGSRPPDSAAARKFTEPPESTRIRHHGNRGHTTISPHRQTRKGPALYPLDEGLTGPDHRNLSRSTGRQRTQRFMKMGTSTSSSSSPPLSGGWMWDRLFWATVGSAIRARSESR